MTESHGGIQSGTKAKGCEHCRQDGCSGHSCRPGATPKQTLCGLLFQVWEMMGPRLVLLLSAALMEPSVLFRGCCFIRPARTPLSNFVTSCNPLFGLCTGGAVSLMRRLKCSLIVVAAPEQGGQS